jgi:hypothetical protein
MRILYQRLYSVALTLGKFIDDLPYPSTSLEELEGAVTEAWEATPEEFRDNAIAIASMRWQNTGNSRAGWPNSLLISFNFLLAELL